VLCLSNATKLSKFLYTIIPLDPPSKYTHPPVEVKGWYEGKSRLSNMFTGTLGIGKGSFFLQDVDNMLIKKSKIKVFLLYICDMMKDKFVSILTKIFVFIVFFIVVPNVSFAQDKGAKTVKTKSKGKKSKRTKGSYNARKRASKRSWGNQNKATRKRMKRAAKNAKRRQKGKSMKNNRLV